jgi:CRP-like cAMP-binding protein
MATPFDILCAYFQERATFSEADLALARTLCVDLTLAAGEFLQRAGEPAKWASFVAKGCLRSYVIDAKGKEHIVQFAPETWWLADSISLMSGAPSQYFIDAIEPTDLIVLDVPSHQRLIEQVPGYATAFRTGLQKHAAAKDQRIVKTLSATAEERYTEFVEMYPSIALRVPQWMLASYLGVTPETVSRIRKNRSRK